jgi:Sperm-tail PG-rich repeat
VAILPEHHLYNPASHIPGPGSYNPNLSQVQEGVKNTKISPSRSSPNRDDGPPGPGSYDYTLKNIGKDCIGYSML